MGLELSIVPSCSDLSTGSLLLDAQALPCNSIVNTQVTPYVMGSVCVMLH